MRRSAGLALILAALWGLMALVPTLQARPATQSQFYHVYRIQKRTPLFRASCKLCHESRRGGRKLNKYGQDLKRAGHYGKYQFKGYRAIEKLDSDKDGFTNGEEIAAHKLPGSRVSRPKRHKEGSPTSEARPKKGKGKRKGEEEAEGQTEEKTDDTEPSSE